MAVTTRPLILIRMTSHPATARSRLQTAGLIVAVVIAVIVWAVSQLGQSETSDPAALAPSASATDSAVAEGGVGASGSIDLMSQLQHTEHFRSSALTHIFSGEINSRGKAVGYHSQTYTDTAGAVVEGTLTTADAQGIYTGQVTVDGVAKAGNGGYSTFFPTDMTAQEVVDAINEAYDDRQAQGSAYVGQGGGLTIQIVLDDTDQIITAYPLQQ